MNTNTPAPASSPADYVRYLALIGAMLLAMAIVVANPTPWSPIGVAQEKAERDQAPRMNSEPGVRT